MNPKEINEVMAWLAENMNELSFDEMVRVGSAISEFMDKITPIYLKHASFDDKTTFLFKM
jgi:hypothetical protein